MTIGIWNEFAGNSFNSLFFLGDRPYRCERVYASDGHHLESDLSKDYPDCCPIAVPNWSTLEWKGKKLLELKWLNVSLDTISLYRINNCNFDFMRFFVSSPRPPKHFSPFPCWLASHFDTEQNESHSDSETFFFSLLIVSGRSVIPVCWFQRSAAIWIDSFNQQCDCYNARCQ